MRVLAGAAFGAALLTVPALASAQPQVFIPTVVMTVTNTTLNFRSVAGLAPATVPDGRISFKLVNKARGWRTFSIVGKTTPQIASGKSKTLTVTLPKRDQYYYSVGAENQEFSVNGVVLAVDACKAPRSSTVAVKMLLGPLAATPNHVPCGKVTFVITNTESSNESFHVSLPNTTEPAPGGTTGEIPGKKTLRVTVRFPFKGVVSFGSGEQFHDTAYSEFGSLAVT
ncbi:MAG TPA: hypothetical protein VG652_09135 [Gaiellaceae bacterium]|nr:hypothetical protein [Gaiellaceae bacterium]